MSEIARHLAHYKGCGYVIAPAGYGKTHLIVEALLHAKSRQLILTHTYAGVSVLRRKAREFRIPGERYHIETIASWVLKLLLSFQKASGWTTPRPGRPGEWRSMYESASRLLNLEFIRELIRVSYGGLFVDEYQDCSSSQHEIILQLARDLSCRVLGDPLQAVFDFGDQEPINWEHDVTLRLHRLAELETPYRWINSGAPQIGEWLASTRLLLEQGVSIDLTAGLPDGVRVHVIEDVDSLLQKQGNVCRYFACDPRETVVGIHKGSQIYKSKCHRLAKAVSGKFASIEEIEGRDMFSFIRAFEETSSRSARLKKLIKLASNCMLKVNENLSAATKRGERAEIHKNTRNPEVARWANAYLDCGGSAELSEFLLALRSIGEVVPTRADLIERLLGVLRKHRLHPNLTLGQAAERYQTEFRHKGRMLRRRRLLGTTLLVKGQEFDHAIVLEACSLCRKELYVALTRGSKSLTIITTRRILRPED